MTTVAAASSSPDSNSVPTTKNNTNRRKRPCNWSPSIEQLNHTPRLRDLHAGRLALRVQELEALVRRLQQDPSLVTGIIDDSDPSIYNIPTLSAVSPAAEAAFLELVADFRSDVSALERFLIAFPFNQAQKQRMARSVWEHLLEDVNDVSDLDSNNSILLAKISTLARQSFFLPLVLFQNQCEAESLQLLGGNLHTKATQSRLATLLNHLFAAVEVSHRRSFIADGGSAKIIRNLVRDDMLLLASRLLKDAFKARSIPYNADLLEIVHLARHDTDAKKLRDILSARLPNIVELLVNSTLDGFPILFQPLIECTKGWVNRLQVLLEFGAMADTIYAPWNCSALHMLCYQKPGQGMTALSGRKRIGRGSETNLIQAARLLLQHGARSVINCTDQHDLRQYRSTPRSSSPLGRTALIQAASAGRLQLCRVLLREGKANWNVMDSSGQSMLDYLVLLKHSSFAVHRRMSASYSCMDLYGLVREFQMSDLLTEELRLDCLGCSVCRFLLRSVIADEVDEDYGDSESESDFMDERDVCVSGSEDKEERDNDSAFDTESKSNSSESIIAPPQAFCNPLSVPKNW